MSYFHNNEGTPKRFLGFKIITKVANKLREPFNGSEKVAQEKLNSLVTSG